MEIVHLCVIFSTIVAILAGVYYKQLIPDGLPDDQYFSVRLYGVGSDIFHFMGYAAFKVGIGDSPIENVNRLLHRWLLFAKEEDQSWQIKDTKISNIPVRIYKPTHLGCGERITGVIYLHGGGWTIGSVDLLHPFTYHLARETDVVVISVDYRLAPKHTFPILFHDCYAVINTVLTNADKYGIDKNRVVVVGDSAGGNLAAAVALKLRDENKKLAAQVLLNPVLQFMDFSLPSMKNRNSAVLTREEIAGYWSYYMTGTLDMVPLFLVNNHSMHLHNSKYSSYIRDDNKQQGRAERKPLDGVPKAVLDGLTDYRASPLMADNLKGLPKTLLVTCEFDVLKDEGVLFKARLQGAGVEVTYRNYMTSHAFLIIQTHPFLMTEEFRQAIRDIADYIKKV